MTNLSKDCLSLIIEELYDDKNSLYHCLLVNKLWCETAVPILWKDPWFFFKGRYNSSTYNRAKVFVNIILLHLSEESKNDLKTHGVDIFSNLPLKQKPLFDYIRFCKYISRQYFNIHDIFCYRGCNSQHRIILEQEIYKLFILKCSLKFLDLTGFKQTIHRYPGAETSLLYIHELHCRGDDDPALFYGISEICRLIEKIYILCLRINSGLAKLIEVQKNLKYIKILIEGDGHHYSNDRIGDFYNKVIVKHAPNIIYFDISVENFLSFYNNLFPRLTNLQKLVLFGLVNNSELSRKLEFSSFSNLQVLNLYNISYSTAIRIIQKAERNLQVVWMNYLKPDSTINDSGQIIQIISQSCPNLKYIKLFLKYEQNFEKFEQLLINCKKLEGIHIYAVDMCSSELGDKLLKILVKSAPTSLYKVQFHLYRFRMESLETFFNNWKGRKSLWFYPIIIEDYVEHSFNTSDLHDRFIEMIEIYIREGVVKTYEKSKNFDFILDYDEFNY